MNIHLILGVRPFERATRPRRRIYHGKPVASLTLPSVAALIPRHHNVVLQDEQVHPLDLDAPMDLAMITAKTFFAPRAYEIATTLRKRGVPVVMGGCHASLNPDEAAQYCDTVVIGEAESVMDELLDDAATGRLKARYQGDQADLRRLPRPRRDLLPKPYIIDGVVVSRGCSHSCKFCYVKHVYGSGFRTRPVGDVVDEIAGLGRYLGFHDNNLVGDHDYARELFTAMVPLRRKWVTQVSVDILDSPGLIALAAKAGARGFFFGLETLNPEVLRSQNKVQNNIDRYRELVRSCHRHGILVCAGMVFGLDGDTLDTFPETLEALNTLGVDLCYTHVATPYPGTVFYDELHQAGRILTTDWSYYDNRMPTFVPKHMSPRQLFEGTCWLNREFYSIRSIANRIGQYHALEMPLWGSLNMNRQERADVRETARYGDELLSRIGC